MSSISFMYTVLLLWFHNQSDTKMLGSLPGKERGEKGGQGIQTNKMDDAGEVLPLCSCSCIQPRHVRAASPTLCWCQQQRRAWTPPERLFSPHFTSLPPLWLSVFSTAVKADRSPPALALALQWRGWREPGWSQTSAWSLQECCSCSTTSADTRHASVIWKSTTSFTVRDLQCN